ncbi:glycoside hydrolase family 79 protein [Hysterangium stoloniferum]|nr:glycoside hydrolase family 79 protein [Hysterangium stoloniferum]
MLTSRLCWPIILSVLLVFLNSYSVNAVTIYTQVTFADGSVPTATASSPTPTHAAYDSTVLTPPPVPNPNIPTNYVLQLLSGGMDGLSIPQTGSFVGFSVELSVADQVLILPPAPKVGKNGTHIQPVLLNLLANIQRRAGSVQLRVGGNTQERAVFFPEGLANKSTILKDKSNLKNPTDTPTIQVGIDLLYAFANISSHINAGWYIGMPFNDTLNPRLGIAEYSQRILGKHLLGVQAGNEPDLYASHGGRPKDYSVTDYFQDFRRIIDAIGSNPNLQGDNILAGPSICCNYNLSQLLDAGYSDYLHNLAVLTVEHYPDNNCNIGKNIKTPQAIFQNYLTHDSIVNTVAPYMGDARKAASVQKPLVMMETNTASCGGFPGISDSFGAALWGIDYALQLAYANFSAAFIHIGGQDVYYNPFTPPPTKDAKRGKQWTIGPMYYASLIIAETFGITGAAQVIDLKANGGNTFTPAYAVYENGIPMRVALFNYITDPSGASSYTARIAIGGNDVGQPNASPALVTVRYFVAPSVSSKHNFLWGNQTFGGMMESDGMLKRPQETVTVQCGSDNFCPIDVPAPGLALVFLAPQAQDESSGNDLVTFATTATSDMLRNTATIPASVLATSNGYGGRNHQVGSTSPGSNGALGMQHAVSGALVCMAVGVVTVVIGRVSGGGYHGLWM